MTELIERESAVPIYQQLEAMFHAKIASGEWSPGQRIPSENELHKTYGLSRMTVRGVLTRMVNDGLLNRVAGKGTFVAQRKISAVSPAYKGIREQLEALGYHTSTTLIALERTTAPTRVSERLRLEADDDVYAIVRLRSVDGKPLSVHRSFVPARLAPDLDTLDVVNEQLCVVLEENFALPMHSVEEDLEAVAVEGADAKLLELRKGDPALHLTDVISDGAGTAFEYSTIVFRGDTMRLKFDYKRV
ncbi:GntR family transcriptional regulator [Georgenia subflava]|uniref:UTRA domain-containing protein n=1 Tax=Georgenia subflava TaxID=1622177 RepID=A0A6N7EQK3_9MICO|nr:GntR family transcriptional regulator [Georgenia subflava]MPV38795.1 UTRA domain-containing protein [Georgenia subflava]